MPDFLTRTRQRSLRPNLVTGLIGGSLLLLLVLMLTDGWLMRLEAVRTAELAERRLGAYQTSLEATIDRHQYLPRVLASDPRILTPLRRLHSEQPLLGSSQETSGLLNLINRQAGSDEIFIMDASGMTHWSSNYQTEDTFVGSNYGFRPYFIDALEGGQGFYYAVGATSGIPGLFFSHPVMQDDEVLGVVVVKIDLAPLEESWLYSGDAVWVTDNKGVIFLSSEPKWHYHATYPLSEEDRAILEDTRQYGASDVPELTRAEAPGPLNSRAFDLGDQGVQLTFSSPISDYPWEMHWRVPVDNLKTVVRAQQTGIVLLYVLFAAGLLYYRERHRRSLAQSTVTQLTAERESHQRAIIQNTDAGLFNLDANFNPLFINEKARALFLLDEAALDGQPEQGRIPARLLQPWQPDARGLGPVRGEGLRGDGSRFPVLYTLNPIRVGNNDEFILTVQDITELTAAQIGLERANQELEARVEARTRDLQEAQAALAQNQKLAALGRMSSAIAHEINQPITALSNYVASSRLLLDHGKPAQVDANLGRIEALVDRLSRLSRQLRVFSGKRNTGSDTISLVAPVRYALDLLSHRLEEQGIHCDLQVSSNHSVQANNMMLEQIMVNLVNNAIDALSEQQDGRIDIRVQPASDGSPGTEVAVRDNGPGISTEQQAQIFEPFYSTKPVGDGVGLGLAISYSLALDMGARLTVHSQPGQGCTFTLTFSASQALPATQQATPTDTVIK